MASSTLDMSRRTQSAIEVEYAIVGELVSCQEDRSVSHLGRVSDAIEGRIFKICLLQFRFKI